MAGVQKSRLARFIESESEVYTRGEFVFYLPELFQISVFTDTTERAPTFSLTPFSHDQATRLLARAPSFSYVSVAQAKSGAEAWRSLLNREPRPLNWHEIDPRTDENYLRAFDFGPAARDFRKRLTNGAVHHDFVISADERALKWSFRDSEIDFEWGRVASPLLMHTFLKMLLNIHSTLIMGRIGRYEGNLMTWVYPNNGKLIDRAARYVRILLERQGVTVSYEDVVRRLLEINRDLPSNTSVVLKTVEAFKGTR